MQRTDNYELNLPEAEDFFNVEDFNDNTKKIDEVLESLENPEHDTGKQAEVEELASGESLKVALRKLAKAVKDLISHLADKVVHITSNERTLWNTVSNKADSNHTHKYAGSSSAGGAATTALACTGNSSTATKLQTARKINGVEFDGSTDITVYDKTAYQEVTCKMAGVGWYRIMIGTGAFYHGILHIARSWGTETPESLTLDVARNGSPFDVSVLSHEGTRKITKIRMVQTTSSPYANTAYIDLYYNSTKAGNMCLLVLDKSGARNFRVNSELSTSDQTLNIVPEELEEGYTSTMIDISERGSYFPKSKIDALTVGSISGVNYAGSSSAGGSANSANKLNTNAGSATQPVYFKDGIPVATTYTLGKSVPSDAVFTDTKYTHPTTAGNKHIPAGGSSGQMLKWSANGTATWTSEINATKATQDGNGNNIVNTYALKHIYDDSSINLGRRANTTVGTESVALGSDVTASGNYSHAEGFATTASGIYSHAEGYFAKASGNSSHAECNGEASGNYSHAEGLDTTASGYCSHAEGHYTTALANQHAQGHYNDTTLAKANSESGTSDDTAFVIGNGTSTAKSNAFRVTGKGVTYAKGAYNSTGADYAEFAEWADGNPNNEDRRGYFVTFDEEKTTMIRKANAGDYVLGIVSGNPCIIGNADEGWLGKYVFDEFGSIVYEDVEVEETYTDETGEEKTRTVKVNTYKINPEYDPTREYIHREKRKEWAAIGWIGVLSVRDDNTCKAGGYCKVTDGGIATAAECGIDTYRVLERVTDNIVKVAIK